MRFSAYLGLVAVALTCASSSSDARPHRHRHKAKLTHGRTHIPDVAASAWQRVHTDRKGLHFVRFGGLLAANPEGTWVSRLTPDGAKRDAGVERLFSTLPSNHRLVSNIFGDASSGAMYLQTQEWADRANVPNLWRLGRGDRRASLLVSSNANYYPWLWLQTPTGALVSYENGGGFRNAEHTTVTLPMGTGFDAVTNIGGMKDRSSILGFRYRGKRGPETVYWDGTKVLHPLLPNVPGGVTQAASYDAFRPTQSGAYLTLECSLPHRSTDETAYARFAYQAIFDGDHWTALTLPTPLQRAKFVYDEEVAKGGLLVDTAIDGSTWVTRQDERSLWSRQASGEWKRVWHEPGCQVRDLAAEGNTVWLIATCGSREENVLWSGRAG